MRLRADHRQGKPGSTFFNEEDLQRRALKRMMGNTTAPRKGLLKVSFRMRTTEDNKGQQRTAPRGFVVVKNITKGPRRHEHRDLSIRVGRKGLTI